MKKNSKTSFGSKKKRLAKKLLGYSAAAGATLAVGHSEAAAEIVYTPVNRGIGYRAADVHIDFDGQLGPEFWIENERYDRLYFDWRSSSVVLAQGVDGGPLRGAFEKKWPQGVEAAYQTHCRSTT